MLHRPKTPAEKRNSEMRRIFYLIQRDGGETGLTQEQLAEKMKLSVKRVGKLLREMRTVHKKHFTRMKKQSLNGKKYYYVKQPQVSLLQEVD